MTTSKFTPDFWRGFIVASSLAIGIYGIIKYKLFSKS
jgi:hypothetical protein